MSSRFKPKPTEVKSPDPAKDVKSPVPVRDTKNPILTKDNKTAAPTKDTKTTIPSKDTKPTLPTKDIKPTPPTKDTKPTLSTKDTKPTTPSKDSKSTAPTKDVKTPVLAKDLKTPSTMKDLKNATAPKDTKPSKDVKNLKDDKNTKEGKDGKSSKPTINIDELLSKLTTEQLENLHTELIDPDDYMTPPSERCRYRTDKSPTFPYNRKKLLDFLEKVAKEDKDWEEEKPYTKEKRGKIWKPKEEEKIKFHEDESKATEWDEILFKASEAELVDLAAILGFHGMLNQVQYHQAFVEGKQSNDAAGFQSIAKYAEFKFFEEDPPNEVDIEDVIKKLEDNDEKLTELNLNNVKDLTIPDLVEVVAALKDNTHLTTLSMANTRATDKVIKALIPVLETNKTLKVVNVESNYISGQAIVQLLSTININQVVEELRVSNQRPLTLGVQNEMEIAKLVKMNGSLLKFNVFLNIVTARLLVQRYVQRNIDNIRRKRVGKDLILPMEDEKPYYLQDQQESKSRAAGEMDEDDVSSDDSDSEEEEEE